MKKTIELNPKTTSAEKHSGGILAMRNLLLIVVGLAIMALPIATLAGVAGSDHDLGTGKVCQNCHTPHNALGDKLWASLPSGTFTGVQDL
ncbi:MAG: hypothetical protein V3T31_06535, partial [candidate division Zixibacteria bacterium]